jgi:hypothetical protein
MKLPFDKSVTINRLAASFLEINSLSGGIGDWGFEI